jgi:phosphopantothenoylcysteine decarboxylase / phosphopantothenate---cysteine ligase
VSKHILIGISGGIAAYKAPDYIRQLKKRGFSTTIILTKNAETFVSKTALEVVSEERVFTHSDFLSSQSYHLSLTRAADCFIIFPATANTLAKCAHGFCDDLLSTSFLSFQGPKAICPAMHTEMYLNEQTQENINHLKKKGVQIIGPISGDLACGDTGVGRLVGCKSILTWLELSEKKQLLLSNKRLLITMGGTRELLDSVRCLSNLSTGKLGKSLATVAHLYGATLTLITTVSLHSNGIGTVVSVKSSDELKNAIENNLSNQDALIMAAAVSDFKGKEVQKKRKRSDSLTLELVGTEDILANLPQSSERVTIGFCLADENLESVAREKMTRKHVNLMIANHVDTIGKSERDFMVLRPNKDTEFVEGASLNEMAYTILSQI